MAGLLSRRPNVKPRSRAWDALPEAAESASTELLGLSSARYLPDCTPTQGLRVLIMRIHVENV